MLWQRLVKKGARRISGCPLIVLEDQERHRKITNPTRRGRKLMAKRPFFSRTSFSQDAANGSSDLLLFRRDPHVQRDR